MSEKLGDHTEPDHEGPHPPAGAAGTWRQTASCPYSQEGLGVGEVPRPLSTRPLTERGSGPRGARRGWFLSGPARGHWTCGQAGTPCSGEKGTPKPMTQKLHFPDAVRAGQVEGSWEKEDGLPGRGTRVGKSVGDEGPGGCGVLGRAESRAQDCQHPWDTVGQKARTGLGTLLVGRPALRRGASRLSLAETRSLGQKGRSRECPRKPPCAEMGWGHGLHLPVPGPSSF